MSNVTAVVVGQIDGEFLWFGGGLLTFKVTSEQTGGAFFIVEDVASRGKTTPLHVHPDHDETFYVIEGELLLHIDGVEYAAGPGAIAMAPRGIAHAFLVVSEQARFLAFVTPGGAVETFMREAGDPALDRVAPPPGLDIERLVAVGERTGAMKVLGPPPFDMSAVAAQ